MYWLLKKGGKGSFDKEMSSYGDYDSNSFRNFFLGITTVLAFIFFLFIILD